MRHYCLAALMVVGSSLAGGPPVGASEHDLKAAYLFNLIRFIEWPPSHALAQNEVVLGVVAKGPLESALRALDAVPLKGRKLKVIAVEESQIATCCDVLLLQRVSAAVRSRIDKLSSAGVLTVGTDGDFIKSGGVASLMAEGPKVIIVLNHRLAAEQGFTVSSQLLEMARLSTGGRP